MGDCYENSPVQYTPYGAVTFPLYFDVVNPTFSSQENSRCEILRFVRSPQILLPIDVERVAGLD